jgi:hypothetical protein
VDAVIDETKAENAVMYLRDSAEAYAKYRGHVLYCDAALRRVKSMQMLGKEGTIAMLEAAAYASDEYHQAMKDLENATCDMERIKALRESAVFAIEMFRSTNSARKQGLNL